ncbi:uncharacterized protein LOC123521485 [Echinops telfairi]|uniref:Uncharacterized protein LOC123521485 n=1 Tax=Echinops telfairi TaxID=9371 RepID=A0AC55CXR8_ECHTE|nr:uncharacterized protein LOC123521485 [Echinops telfairi]
MEKFNTISQIKTKGRLRNSPTIAQMQVMVEAEENPVPTRFSTTQGQHHPLWGTLGYTTEENPIPPLLKNYSYEAEKVRKEEQNTITPWNAQKNAEAKVPAFRNRTCVSLVPAEMLLICSGPQILPAKLRIRTLQLEWFGDAADTISTCHSLNRWKMELRDQGDVALGSSVSRRQGDMCGQFWSRLRILHWSSTICDSSSTPCKSVSGMEAENRS